MIVHSVGVNDRQYDAVERYTLTSTIDGVVRTERDVLEASGFDADTTPVDTLMRQPGLGLAVAWEMEHGDDPFPE